MEVAAYLINHHPDPPEPPVQHTFEAGKLVWLHDKSESSKAGSKKLANLCQGPFLILEVLTNRLVRLLRHTTVSPRHEIRVSIDRLRPYLIPIYQPWMQGSSRFEFPLFILAKKNQNGNVLYKVQWLSMDPTPDTWEHPEKLPLQLNFIYEELLRNKFVPVLPPLPLEPHEC